jgi:hypothetical protein
VIQLQETFGCYGYQLFVVFQIQNLQTTVILMQGGEKQLLVQWLSKAAVFLETNA